MTPQPLTAELCARAVVASARALGVNPIWACEAERGLPRRVLPVAGAAVAQATQSAELRVERLLQIGHGSISRARRKGGDTFLFALTQALLAIGGPALANAPVTAARTKIAADDLIEGEFTVVEVVKSAAKINPGGGGATQSQRPQGPPTPWRALRATRWGIAL